MLGEILSGVLMTGSTTDGAHCIREGATPRYDCTKGNATVRVSPEQSNPDGTVFSPVDAYDNNTGQTLFVGNISKSALTLDFFTPNGIHIRGDATRSISSISVTETEPENPCIDTSGR